MNDIFGLQTNCARSGDSYYLAMAFPLQQELVCTLGSLNTPKDKVAFLKIPGMNPEAVIAMQVLQRGDGSPREAQCRHAGDVPALLHRRQVFDVTHK